VQAVTALSAIPAERASGIGGPINRFALDVSNFDPQDASARVECRYMDSSAYRCRFEPVPGLAAPGRRRISVSVPDIGAGLHVVLKLVSSLGAAPITVDLANPPQVVHEIESLALPNGGRTVTGPDGNPQPVLNVLSLEATTSPDIAVSTARSSQACDTVYAVWNNASASDATFSSAFGPVAGTVLLARPLTRGGPVRQDNLPHWLITYPASAIRVQFIAHYEMVYRAAVCPERAVS
jgi:hypothetical protein